VIASVYHPHLIRRPCPSRPGASRSTDPSSWRLAYQPPGWCVAVRRTSRRAVRTARPRSTDSGRYRVDTYAEHTLVVLGRNVNASMSIAFQW